MKQDPLISRIISREAARQQDTLQMIPSENYASKAVREAVGSILMNKYAEGQPKKRYYQGMKNVDELELLVEQRALKAFGLNDEGWGANVQPYSGTPANLAVYTALLKPGDKIMAMYLPDGGHLSHGWIFKEERITFTSKIFEITYYHVDPQTKVFNYTEIEKIARKEKPKLLISGGTAYPRIIDHEKMSEIAHSVGAYYLADIAHEAGLIVGKAFPSPFPYADAVTMTTHKTLRGPRGAIIVGKKDLLPAIDKAIFPGLQGGPHMHTIAGIGVALEEAMQPEFKTYAKQVVTNAQVLADELGRYGYDVVSGGTDKHLVLLDLRNKNMSGKIPAIALEYAHIICNFNTVPFDDAPPLYPSGLRLGTPTITTRGMKEKEMKQIAGWIDEVIWYVSAYKVPSEKDDRIKFFKTLKVVFSSDIFLKDIAAKVTGLTSRFPLS